MVLQIEETILLNDVTIKQNGIEPFQGSKWVLMTGVDVVVISVCTAKWRVPSCRVERKMRIVFAAGGIGLYCRLHDSPRCF